MRETGWDELAVPITAAIDRLLPDRYAAFRPLVVEGLAAFLRALPAHRRAELEARQAALPADAIIERRLLELLRASPTLHKLGQVLARNPRLDATLRSSLQRLESLPPSLATADVMPHLGSALESAELGEPLREGSVAIVLAMTGRTREGTRVPGVLKVLKPGIEERLAEDLAAWPELGLHLQAHGRALGLADVGWIETLDQVRDLMLAEIDLRSEQRHLEAAAKFYRGDSTIVVPRLLEGCGPRVTAMTRIDGAQVTAIGAEHVRRRAARAIVDTLIARPLFSGTDPVLVHGDPHAGNLFWTTDGRLGVLDWALAGTIDQRSLALTASVVLAALRLDGRGIGQSLQALAKGHVDRAALGRVVSDTVRELLRGVVPGVSWLISLLDRTAFEAGARFDQDLLLFRKSLLTLDGVVQDLAPRYPIALHLALEGAGRLIDELPRRFLTNPTSRDFSTHLSNLDLLSLSWLGATRARNAWSEIWRDVLAAAPQSGQIARV